VADRPLAPEEAALWRRLVASVEPLAKHQPKALTTATKPVGAATPAIPAAPSAPALTQPAAPKSAARPPQRPAVPPPPPLDFSPGRLDSHIDRRLDRGRIEPDVRLDLHERNLGDAYAQLDATLELAIAAGHRTILLIAGRPRGYDRARALHGDSGGRGAIRAALDDWLHASRHARHIAAVRNAHPRHGGAGALYILLKRGR
jgi:DNA-nicking Smr family endonuclease